MLKAGIRKQALDERLSLSNADYDALNKTLLDQFKLLDFTNIRTLHIFLPITEKKEVNTFLFIQWLAEFRPEIKIIVPRSDFETALLTHHEYLGLHDLKKNLYNILEPQKGKIHEGDIDMVIVPLLAFDKRGFRVGYGKGFYDRFLQNVNTKKIGLSLFPAVDQIEDVHEYDIRLDLCITPTEIIEF